MKTKILYSMMALMMIILLSFTLIACSSKSAVDEDSVLNFSDYQKAPKDADAIKGNDYQAIDFAKDTPVQIVKKAISNGGGASQSSRVVITNSTISSEPNKGLDELRQIVQRSTYMETHNARGSYRQVISGMLKLETNSNAINSIVSAIIGSFGYCTRNCTLDGTSYSSSGKNPKFTSADDKVTRPAGASCKWSKWETDKGRGGSVAEVGDARLTDDQINELLADYKSGKYDIVQDDAGGLLVTDPVTGETVRAIRTVSPFNGKEYAAATYITSGDQYQIDDSVIDLNKSSVEFKKSDKFYEIKLVYKRGKSSHSEYYDSVIDQACRVAAGMLLVDTNNTPLKIGRIRYTDLSIVAQVWDSGMIKKIQREEQMQVVADFNVVVKKGTGLGKSVNNATEIYSYSDRDTDIEYLHSGKEFA